MSLFAEEYNVDLVRHEFAMDTVGAWVTLDAGPLSSFKIFGESELMPMARKDVVAADDEPRDRALKILAAHLDGNNGMRSEVVFVGRVIIGQYCCPHHETVHFHTTLDESVLVHIDRENKTVSFKIYTAVGKNYDDFELDAAEGPIWDSVRERICRSYSSGYRGADLDGPKRRRYATRSAVAARPDVVVINERLPYDLVPIFSLYMWSFTLRFRPEWPGVLDTPDPYRSFDGSDDDGDNGVVFADVEVYSPSYGFDVDAVGCVVEAKEVMSFACHFHDLLHWDLTFPMIIEFFERFGLARAGAAIQRRSYLSPPTESATGVEEDYLAYGRFFFSHDDGKYYVDADDDRDLTEDVSEGIETCGQSHRRAAVNAKIAEEVSACAGLVMSFDRERFEATLGARPASSEPWREVVWSEVATDINEALFPEERRDWLVRIILVGMLIRGGATPRPKRICVYVNPNPGRPRYVTRTAGVPFHMLPALTRVRIMRERGWPI